MCIPFIRGRIHRFFRRRFPCSVHRRVRGNVQQIRRRRRFIPQTIDHFPFDFNFSLSKRSREFFLVLFLVRNFSTSPFSFVFAYVNIWSTGIVAETKLVVYFAIVVNPNRIRHFIPSKRPRLFVNTKRRAVRPSRRGIPLRASIEPSSNRVRRRSRRRRARRPIRRRVSDRGVRRHPAALRHCPPFAHDRVEICRRDKRNNNNNISIYRSTKNTKDVDERREVFLGKKKEKQGKRSRRLSSSSSSRFVRGSLVPRTSFRGRRLVLLSREKKRLVVLVLVVVLFGKKKGGTKNTHKKWEEILPPFFSPTGSHSRFCVRCCCCCGFGRKRQRWWSSSDGLVARSSLRAKEKR